MLEVPERALVVAAHPDDAEFGCSGTVAKWARAGAEVYYVLCTDGGKGTSNREITSEALARIRAQEQQEACNILGVKDLVMLGYPDGELEDTREFRGHIVRAIRQFRPDVVITSNPFHHNTFSHRDHRVAGLVTMDAMFPYARDHLHYPELLKEGLEPHKAGSILFWGSETPNTYIDITETIDLKLKALAAHRSQLPPENFSNIEKMVRERARENGAKLGVEYAEAFRRIDFRR